MAKHLVYRLEYVFVLCLMAMFRLAKPQQASALGAVLGQMTGFFLRGASRRAETQIARAMPELSKSECLSIRKAMWRNLGRNVAEYSQLPQMLAQEQTSPGRYFDIHDPHGCLEVARQGRGTVFACAHFGNWEVIGAIGSLAGVDAYAFGRPLNNPYVERLVVQFREGLGLKLLSKGTGREGLGRLLGVLRRGGAVGMLVDQAQRGGVHSRFFGQEVRTSPAFVSVAYHLNVQVVPMLISRVGESCRFRVDIYAPLTLPDTGNRQADINSVVRGYDAWLEARIRERPDQWLWLHRRWKSWPNHERHDAERAAARNQDAAGTL